MPVKLVGFLIYWIKRSGSVDKEEFMIGCLQLKGEAKSLDVAIMQADIEVLLQGVADLNDNLDMCMLKINKCMLLPRNKASIVNPAQVEG